MSGSFSKKIKTNFAKHIVSQFLRFIISLLVISLTGCNSYQKFFSPSGLGSNYTPPKDYHGQPQIYNVPASDHSRVYQQYIDQGYLHLGDSEFSSGMNPSQREAKNLAKKIGADIVLMSKSYQRTVHGSYNFTTPTQTTTYHSGNVNTYGSYGNASGYYSGSSTTYGTQTTNIPYSINRYNYRASFFVYNDSVPSTLQSRYKPNPTHPEFLRLEEELFEKWDRGEISMQEQLDELDRLREIYSKKQKSDYKPSELYAPPLKKETEVYIPEPPVKAQRKYYGGAGESDTSEFKSSTSSFDEEKAGLFKQYRAGEITKDEYFQKYKQLRKRYPLD